MAFRNPRLVTFNVYDLRGLGFFNAISSANGMGAYHGGIEVFSLEWSYGAPREDLEENLRSPGVFAVLPGKSSLGTLKCKVALGYTPYTLDEVLECLEQFYIDEYWSAENYHLLQRNCCHFSTAFAKRLGIPQNKIPPWINYLADSLSGNGEDIEKFIAKTNENDNGDGFEAQSKNLQEETLTGWSPLNEKQVAFFDERKIMEHAVGKNVARLALSQYIDEYDMEKMLHEKRRKQNERTKKGLTMETPEEIDKELEELIRMVVNKVLYVHPILHRLDERRIRAAQIIRRLKLKLHRESKQMAEELEIAAATQSSATSFGDIQKRVADKAEFAQLAELELDLCRRLLLKELEDEGALQGISGEEDLLNYRSLQPGSAAVFAVELVSTKPFQSKLKNVTANTMFRLDADETLGGPPRGVPRGWFVNLGEGLGKLNHLCEKNVATYHNCIDYMRTQLEAFLENIINEAQKEKERYLVNFKTAFPENEGKGDGISEKVILPKGKLGKGRGKDTSGSKSSFEIGLDSTVKIPAHAEEEDKGNGVSFLDGLSNMFGIGGDYLEDPADRLLKLVRDLRANEISDKKRTSSTTGTALSAWDDDVARESSILTLLGPASLEQTQRTHYATNREKLPYEPIKLGGKHTFLQNPPAGLSAINSRGNNAAIGVQAMLNLSAEMRRTRAKKIQNLSAKLKMTFEAVLGNPFFFPVQEGARPGQAHIVPQIPVADEISKYSGDANTVLVPGMVRRSPDAPLRYRGRDLQSIFDKFDAQEARRKVLEFMENDRPNPQDPIDTTMRDLAMEIAKQSRFSNARSALIASSFSSPKSVRSPLGSAPNSPGSRMGSGSSCRLDTVVPYNVYQKLYQESIIDQDDENTPTTGLSSHTKQKAASEAFMKRRLFPEYYHSATVSGVTVDESMVNRGASRKTMHTDEEGRPVGGAGMAVKVDLADITSINEDRNGIRYGTPYKNDPYRTHVYYTLNATASPLLDPEADFGLARYERAFDKSISTGASSTFALQSPIKLEEPYNQHNMMIICLGGGIGNGFQADTSVENYRYPGQAGSGINVNQFAENVSLANSPKVASRMVMTEGGLAPDTSRTSGVLNKMKKDTKKSEFQDYATFYKDLLVGGSLKELKKKTDTLLKREYHTGATHALLSPKLMNR